MTQEKRMTREDRRKQILDSALKIFTKKGYNGATTVDIAKEAQISEVTLFRYFDSKKQIFMEAIEPVLLTSFKESIEESKTFPSKNQLKYIFKNRIEFVSENQEVIKLILMESQINPELADFNLINQIRNLLIDSMREEGIRVEDEDYISRILVGSILSFLYLPKLSEGEIDSYAEKLINKIIK